MPSAPFTLLISAPASHQGKTSVTAGLARSFVRAGKRVRVLKIGPDFLDPMILESACQTPVRQVDLWMMGDDECRRVLAEAGCEADVVLVEGALGLFDGEPATADFAERFGLPVALVIDARGMAQTVQAIAHGLATFRPSLNIRGFVANNVGSSRHETMLAGSGAAGVSYLGAIYRHENVTLPSRHLGLHQAVEIEQLDSILDRLADVVEATKLREAPAGMEPNVRTSSGHSTAKRADSREGLDLSGLTVAIARDACFSFIYHGNIEFLEEQGARVVYFSPLRDLALPTCDSIYLPGGYPELHAEALAANEQMMAALRGHVQAGKPVYAECGGMMYLLDAVVAADGRATRLVGVVPGRAVMGKRMAALGYQTLALGDEIARGHTFHYSRMETDMQPFARAVSRLTGQPGEPVFRQGSITASYLHLYFPTAPRFIIASLKPGVLAGPARSPIAAKSVLSI